MTIKSQGGEIKEVTVQRNILGILAAKYCDEGMAINLHKALQYPLAPLPLALATLHGTPRNRPKSKIMETILNSLNDDTSQAMQFM